MLFEGDTKTYVLTAIILALLIVIWLLWRSSSRNYARAEFAWKFLKAFNNSLRDPVEKHEDTDIPEGIPTFQVKGVCQGPRCPCQKGAPCTGLPEHMAYMTQDKDVVHLCPMCNKKMYTLQGGDPYVFTEHQCGCGHWGWLHLFP